ncbi:hypothetical protein [uncultured Fibrella sp.]|uniref:hypothetical protein n=1 Tax=uncultured Fibrella sp. TaxID=1284596 RepID=UPI0035CBB288
MNKLLSLIRLACVLVLCQSCRTVYTPNALNVPLLQEQGEIKLLVAPNNYQAAYAVTDKIGIIANGRVATSANSSTINGAADNFDAKNTVFEAGVGYYGRTGRNLTYELYGGGGISQVGFHGTGSSVGKNYDVSGMKFFVQPNIGFTSRGFDIAFSTRLSGLQFSTATGNYTATDLKNNDLDGLAKSTHLFLEPAITLRGGYKYVKLQMQLGGSFKLTQAVIPYNGLIANVGLVFDFAQWYND